MPPEKDMRDSFCHKRGETPRWQKQRWRRDGGNLFSRGSRRLLFCSVNHQDIRRGGFAIARVDLDIEGKPLALCRGRKPNAGEPRDMDKDIGAPVIWTK